MRRRGQEVGTRVWVAVAGGLALLMSGCTGGPDPAPSSPAAVATPTVAPTPTPSAPPRPTLPEQPAAMAEPTAEGAEAAARYFLELDRYAFMSGDAQPIRSMSAESCVYCNELIASVEQSVAGGVLTDRDPDEVVRVSVVETLPAEWFNVDLRLRQGEIRVLGNDGSVIATQPPSQEVDLRLALSWDSGRWSVDAGMVEVPQA